MPQPSHQTLPSLSGSTSAGLSHSVPNLSCTDGKPQEGAENSRAHAPQNGKASDREEPTSSTPPGSASPISKYILSALFDALGTDELQNQSRQCPNYVFIDHDQEYDFLYGLVLPVIARLLAVSYPGLLCVVQLPKPVAVPEWAAPMSSDVSNGSKSGGRTTPHDSSRTTPSDEEAVPRKSQSPEAPPMTAELIRHADHILSGADASADRGTIDNDIAAKSDPGSSPPPSSVNKDHRVLPSICNGFEVLTGKMPPPRYNMGSFTLASVGWEKAGIVSPEHPSKGVTMSFSNGMMMPTEGIVVTFSNGSMCLLTLQDPLTMLDTMKVNDTTPVIMFLFSQLSPYRLGNILSQDPGTLDPDAAKVRGFADRQNLFFVEIGCALEGAPGGVIANCRGEKSHSSKSMSLGSSLGTSPTFSTPPLSTKSVPFRSSLKTEFGTSAGSSLGSILTPSPRGNDTKMPGALKIPPRCPAVTVTAIPRAVPLFVNTINQTFIDPPFYDVPERAYEDELISDKYREVPYESLHGERDAPMPKTEGSRTADVNLAKKRKLKNGRALSVRGEVEAESDDLKTANSSESLGLGENDFRKNSRQLDVSATPPISRNIDGESRHCGIPHSLHSSHLIDEHSPKTHDEIQNQHLPSMFNVLGQRQGHIYHCGSHLPSVVQTSQSLIGSQAFIHGAPASINEAHSGYYHPMQPKPYGPSGHYRHPHRSHYSEHPYCSVQIPNSMIHSNAPPQNGSQWQHGIPTMAHQTSSPPPPHLIDARRDMPVHFSSHHAGASGQYPSQYFSHPSYHGHMPVAQPKRPAMRIIPEHQDPAFNPHVTKSSKGSGFEAGNTVCTADAPHSGPKAPKSTRKHAAMVPSQTDRDQRAKLVETQENGKRPARPSSGQNDPQSPDRENALRALIQMRQGFPNDNSLELEAKRRSGPSSTQTRDNVTDHALPSERQISELSKKRPNESLEAYNDASRDEGQNACKLPLPKEGADKERGENSETSSTASTNSQGGALMKDSVTGNSHDLLQKTSSLQPDNKRPQKS